MWTSKRVAGALYPPPGNRRSCCRVSVGGLDGRIPRRSMGLDCFALDILTSKEPLFY